MKECIVFKKNLCLGCTGLAERDWVGADNCEIYKKYKGNYKNENIWNIRK